VSFYNFFFCCSAKQQPSRRASGDRVVAKLRDSSPASVMRKSQDQSATAAAGRRSVDVESSRTYNVDGGSSTASSLSTPRTYVVEVLAETDDECSHQTSPRLADRQPRRCRRRRPQSLDSNQYNRHPHSTLAKDGRPEVGYSSHQSTSTETFVLSKAASASAESLRRRRRRATTTSPSRAAGVVASTPNLPEFHHQPPPSTRRRQSSASSDGDVVVPSRAEQADVRVPSRDDADDAAATKSRTSRLPRLVSRPQDTLPSTSSVSATLVRAPRPRSFRYSRLHRRAVDAMVPPPLRDLPWRWAWKANTDLN